MQRQRSGPRRDRAAYSACLACVLTSATPILLGGCTPHRDAGVATTATDVRQVGLEADDAVRRMSDFLGNQSQFRVEAEIVNEQLDAAGYRIQYSDFTTIEVARPNMLRATIDGDRLSRRVWYNGKSVSVLDTEQNCYSVVDAPSDIDAMLDHMVTNYGAGAPVADVIVNQVYDSLMRNVVTGSYVGLHRVGTWQCHHLAFSQPSIDWQIWIENSDTPFPRRLTIVYKNNPARPMYMATFARWDTTANLAPGDFEFQPPADARQVPMEPRDTSAGQ
ncbi:MAG: DUF2092 domain-containing protein [Phycisphaerae bacterium]